MENRNDKNLIIDKCNIGDFGDVDFVAIALSGWHLSVVLSYFISLNKKLSGVIYVNRSRISEEMLVRSEYVNITYVNIDSLQYKKALKV